MQLQELQEKLLQQHEHPVDLARFLRLGLSPMQIHAAELWTMSSDDIDFMTDQFTRVGDGAHSIVIPALWEMLKFNSKIVLTGDMKAARHLLRCLELMASQNPVLNSLISADKMAVQPRAAKEGGEIRVVPVRHIDKPWNQADVLIVLAAETSEWAEQLKKAERQAGRVIRFWACHPPEAGDSETQAN